jgi:hypothetical protein
MMHPVTRKTGARRGPRSIPVWERCAWCKELFEIESAAERKSRWRRSKSGKLFCCQDHFHRWQSAQTPLLAF